MPAGDDTVAGTQCFGLLPQSVNLALLVPEHGVPPPRPLCSHPPSKQTRITNQLSPDFITLESKQDQSLIAATTFVPTYRLSPRYIHAQNTSFVRETDRETERKREKESEREVRTEKKQESVDEKNTGVEHGERQMSGDTAREFIQVAFASLPCRGDTSRCCRSMHTLLPSHSGNEDDRDSHVHCLKELRDAAKEPKATAETRHGCCNDGAQFAARHSDSEGVVFPSTLHQPYSSAQLQALSRRLRSKSEARSSLPPACSPPETCRDGNPSWVPLWLWVVGKCWQWG